MYSLTKLAAAAALVAGVSAKTIPITVGEGGQLAFKPDTITAAKGDILEFTFFPAPHSVAMGDFNNACHPASSGGFYSGFVNSESMKFSVLVNNTDPFPIYCTQPELSHCKNGMVAVVNPSGQNTLAAYQKAASGSSSVSSPPSVFGGSFGSISGGGGSSSSSSGSSPSSSSAPSGSSSPSGSSTPSSGGSSSTPTGSSAAPTQTGASNTLQASLFGICVAAMFTAAML